MTVVLVAGAIAVVGAAVIWATWRRSSDERQSVKDYHHTLETLRHLSDRNAANKLRGPGTGPTGASSPSTPSAPSAAAPASAGTSDSGSVIGRSAPEKRSGATPVGASGRGGSVRQASQAEESASRRRASPVSELASARALYRYPRGGRARAPRDPRRTGVLSAAAVVVLVVVAVALALAPSHSSPGRRSPSARASGTTRASRSASSASTSANSGKQPSSRRRTTATTVPLTLQPTTASAAEAVYTTTQSSYTVALSASAPCWILATDTTTGKVLWTGTLEAGEVQQIPAAGDLVIRLGAAFVVTLTLDGEPVTLPAGHGSPFDVTFQSD